MQRVAFVLHVKPGCEQEYRDRHAQVWPELCAEMESAGLRGMVIVLLGSKAVVLIEAEDYERSAAFLSTAPASVHWEKYMADILETESGGAYEPDRAWPVPIPLAFDWTSTK